MVLAIISMILAENFDIEKSGSAIDLVTDEVSGTKSFENKERFMHIMSRFSLAFVNVASKVFLFKEAAIQKAWSRISEMHNNEKFDEVMQ